MMFMYIYTCVFRSSEAMLNAKFSQENNSQFKGREPWFNFVQK